MSKMRSSIIALVSLAFPLMAQEAGVISNEGFVNERPLKNAMKGLLPAGQPLLPQVKPSIPPAKKAINTVQKRAMPSACAHIKTILPRDGVDRGIVHVAPADSDSKMIVALAMSACP